MVSSLIHVYLQLYVPYFVIYIEKIARLKASFRLNHLMLRMHPKRENQF